MVSILLGLPISVEQAKARGIREGVCQLVVRGPLTGREAVLSLEFALARAGGEAHVLVVGAFQSADVLNKVFQGEPTGELWACKVFRVPTAKALVAALSQLDAEEAAVFTGTQESVARFIEAVRSREVGWWRLSSTSVFGALGQPTRLGRSGSALRSQQ